MSRRALILAVAVLVVLAGCAGGGVGDSGDDGGEARTAQGEAPPEDTASERGDDAAESGGVEETSADAADRQVQQALIRTGTVSLRVDDFADARVAVADLARSRGGYVSDSEQTLHSDDETETNWTSGYVVVRVPAEEFSSLLSAVREEGVVLSEHTETTDVGDQLVDLEARLDNLEARRDRLRDFYDRANTTEELLRIEERLSDVQSEIERLRAQQRSLEDRVAYSTLRVELSEPGPSTPTPTPTPTPEPAYHETSVTTAFFDSIDAIVVLARTAVVTGAYLLPYLLVGGPVAIGLVILRRRRSRRGGGRGRRPPTRDTTSDDVVSEPDGPDNDEQS